MKHVAILGGGPAGAFAAARLAAAGIEATLIDEKLAWEKPCGGGVTYKACERYPFLFENSIPKQVMAEASIAAPRAGMVSFKLRHPMVIYSRRELNGLLIDRARQAGVRVERARVLSAGRRAGAWHIETSAGPHTADFCVLALGARNPLRELGTQLRPADTVMAMAYHVAGTAERVDIEFLSGLDGYVWVFPRHDHISYGIGGKGEPSARLRARLEDWMRSKRISFEGAPFHAHLLPSLAPEAWKQNRLEGEGWFAAGDAGGLVDPITGEGIYFALRSGEVAAECIADGTYGRPGHYTRRLAEEFTADLAYGSSLGARLGSHMSAAAAVSVQWMRRSPAFSGIMQDLISGAQPYLDLKSRLVREMAPAGLGSLFRTGSISLRMVGRILGYQS